ncbi:MAG: N-acetylmuramoyl-L-alanine amidase [Oscillospiraceae bacterium]|nr:N-acetylmuramoyl-L-alanine amidase [Oscillospiraceae bacterium]
MSRENKSIIIALSVFLAALIPLTIFFYARNKDAEPSPPGITNPQGGATEPNLESSLPMPKIILGAFLTAGRDYKYGDADIETVKASINTSIFYMSTIPFNAAFISSGYEGKPLLIGGGFDPAAYAVDVARLNSMFAVLCVDAEFIFSDLKNLILVTDALAVFAKSTNANAIMITGLDEIDFSDSEIPGSEISLMLSDRIAEIRLALKTEKKDLFVGVSVSANYEKSFIENSANTVAWFENNIVDFIYVASEYAIAPSDNIFRAELNYWNNMAIGKKTYIYYGHRADLISSDEDWNDPEELRNQAEAVREAGNVRGSVFYSYEDIRLNKNNAAMLLCEYIKENMTAGLQNSSLAMTSPTSNKIKTGENRISFLGAADPSLPLYCNEDEVKKSVDGLFSLEKELDVGENRFVFTQNGAGRTYLINYEADIIKDVKPKGATTAPGDTVLELAALAYRNSKVTARIGGAEIELKESARNEFSQSAGDRGYVTYTGQYTLPKSTTADRSMGAVIFLGELNGNATQKQSGNVTVMSTSIEALVNSLAAEEPKAVSLYAEKKLPLLTPYGTAGSEKALMCEIVADYAETMPAGEADNKSSPLYIPLVKGTFDYIDNIAVYDDTMYYILGSGRKIFAKDAKLIKDGAVLPENKITAHEADIGGKATELYFKTDWAVPVNCAMSPQEYYVGYDNRPFSINEFTADTVDVTFYYTSSATGSFNVKKSGVISEAAWVKSGGNTATLRLKLKEKGGFYGYSVTITDSGEIKLSFKNKPSNTLKGKTIMLDPGHGGTQPGTYTVYPDMYEKTVNLAAAYKAKEILEKNGAKVIMTRTDDKDLTLAERALMARNAQPDAFISIHCDGSASASVNGTHSFYYNAYSKSLASNVHSNLVKAYRTLIYQAGTEEFENADKGVKFYPFEVARITDCPAMLVELGYLTNASNCNVLLTPYYRDALGAAVADGVRDFFEK